MHGKGVNRSFPRSKKGSLASRMAYYLMKEFLNNVDLAIDFHTGGSQRNNFPKIRYKPEDARGFELIKVFNTPLIFNTKLIPKSFKNQCYKNNILVIVYEGGESLRLEENVTQLGINGKPRVLK